MIASVTSYYPWQDILFQQHIRKMGKTCQWVFNICLTGLIHTGTISDKTGLGLSARMSFSEEIIYEPGFDKNNIHCHNLPKKWIVLGIYSSVLLIGSASCPVKEKNVIRIKSNDAKIVRWMFNVRLEKYHEKMLTESFIARVWLSRKNGVFTKRFPR